MNLHSLENAITAAIRDAGTDTFASSLTALASTCQACVVAHDPPKQALLSLLQELTQGLANNRVNSECLPYLAVHVALLQQPSPLPQAAAEIALHELSSFLPRTQIAPTLSVDVPATRLLSR